MWSALDRLHSIYNNVLYINFPVRTEFTKVNFFMGIISLLSENNGILDH